MAIFGTVNFIICDAGKLEKNICFYLDRTAFFNTKQFCREFCRNLLVKRADRVCASSCPCNYIFTSATTCSRFVHRRPD